MANFPVQLVARSFLRRFKSRKPPPPPIQSLLSLSPAPTYTDADNTKSATPDVLHAHCHVKKHSARDPSWIGTRGPLNTAGGNLSHVQSARNHSIGRSACAGTLRRLIRQLEAEGGICLSGMAVRVGRGKGAKENRVGACTQRAGTRLGMQHGWALQYSRCPPINIMHLVSCVSRSLNALLVHRNISKSIPPQIIARLSGSPDAASHSPSRLDMAAATVSLAQLAEAA